MKYRITKKENDEFTISVLIDSEEKVLEAPGEFSYREFVNYLYHNKGKQIDFEFVGLTVEEMKKINEFMKQVYKIFTDEKDDVSENEKDSR